MKRTIIFLFFSMSLCNLIAQKTAQDTQSSSGYVFTTVKELPITSIKNQNRTSTCWSFSAISLIESEFIRMGKGRMDLSEMFIVSNALKEKAIKYIRTDGKINFAPGGSFSDVLHIIKTIGIVPESEMSGLCYGEKLHVHNELDAVLKGFLDALLTKPNGKLTLVWTSAYQGILDAYLGVAPKTFIENGHSYTPKTYAESLGINTDDYVSITSFTHHPFYTKFALEIPDNWRWDLSYNVPMEELTHVIDYAINNGYTVAWGTDDSEKGYSNTGIALVQEIMTSSKSGYERQVNQLIRQEEFDNGLTTDDHGMHIFGIAKDQRGAKFYMVKNSFGEIGQYKGIWYVSENYVRFKTIDMVLHKDAIPKEIRNKLGL